MTYKLRVAWLTNINLMNFYQAAKSLDASKLDIQHTAGWISVMLDEIMVGYPDIELYVITLQSGELLRKKDPIVMNNGQVTVLPIKTGAKIFGLRVPYLGYLSIISNHWLKALRIRKTLKSIDPDIVNVFGTESEYQVAGWGIKKPVLLSIQGLLQYRPNPTLYQKLQIKLEKRSLGRYRHFMTANSEFIESTIKQYNHGASFCREDFPVHRILFEHDFISGKIFDFVFSGGISKQKGAEDFVKAIALVKKNMPQVKAIMIGIGKADFIQYLRSLICQMGLEMNIQILGYVEDYNEVFSLIGASKVFVLPTLFDTGPRSIAEAMSIGTPVISYNTMGVKDMIEHNNTGMLVEVGNVSDLATEMSDLLSDESKRYRIAWNAKEKADRLYHPHLMMGRLITYYKRMILAG